jgi:hypothetical protein
MFERSDHSLQRSVGMFGLSLSGSFAAATLRKKKVGQNLEIAGGQRLGTPFCPRFHLSARSFSHPGATAKSKDLIAATVG